MSLRIAIASAAILLGACASLQAPSALPELASAPGAFEMSGRLSVRQGDSSDIARLRWTHKADGDLWVVASPLGNEVARIESSGAGASLTRAGAPAERAASFAELTQRLLGASLDPAVLASWLHGGTRDETPTEWKVKVEETQRAGAIDLARRMSATRGDVVVRLVVDEYRTLPE